MTIQSCSVEILDKIFEEMAHSDPENTQATLFSLMSTCSHFHTIAKRHFIRIVCLPNAAKVNAFGGYLKQVVGSGDYGNSLLPIQHLAVAGEYRIRLGLITPNHSDAEIEAGKFAPFIISTAAPSLLSLAIFGMDTDFGPTSDDVSHHTMLCVPNETSFPKLRDLIALEQHVIHLVLRDHNGNPDKRACQLRYPILRRLYIPGYGGSALSSTLPYLDDLRLEILDVTCSCPPQDEVGHVRSLIIDAPEYITTTSSCFLDDSQALDEHSTMISECQTLVNGVGNPERSGVVIPLLGFTRCTGRDRILSGWADAVVGGTGCWTTAWVPTFQLIGKIV